MTSPAVDLLLAAVRHRYGAATDQDVQSAAAAIPAAGWDAAFDAARVHAVTPLLDLGLAKAGAEIPTEAREHLDGLVAQNRIRNLGLTGELSRIVARFERAGVRVVPYKGPVLAATAYGDVALREFVDLDLLVDPANVDTACDLLEADGYQELHPVTPRRRRHMMATGHDLKLVHHANRFVVEVQWGVVDHGEMGQPDLAPMLDRATSVPVAGRPMPNLSAEDLLLVLCIHGSMHLWERMAWACDVAELLRSNPGLDVDTLARRAAHAGVRRVLLLGLEMTRRIAGAPVPERLLEAIDRDPGMAALGDVIEPMTLAREGLLDHDHDEDAAAGPYLKLLLVMRDTRRERRRQLRRAIFTPSASDWLTIPLPDALFPAYYAMRPVRLAWSYVVRDRRPGDAAPD